MTDRELMKEALEALKHLCLHSAAIKGYDGEQVQTAIDALRARLAQPEPAECDGGQCGIGGYCKQCPKTQPEQEQMPTKIMGPNLEEVLNAAGFYKQREWIGLTDKDIEDCLEMSIQGTCRAIEAKLKEKNGG